MSQRSPLTTEEKEQIYREKIAGKTLAEIAKTIPSSIMGVRK
jgi:hypothetical protein